MALGDPPLVTSEPVRANPALNPCTSQSSTTVERTTAGPVSVDAVAAFTTREAVAGASFASASQPKIELPGLTVEVFAVQALARATCEGGAPATSGSSKVGNIEINGNVIAIPADNAYFELDLGPLGKIQLNEQVIEGTTLTQRAVHITTPVTEVVLSESIAGIGPAGCAGTGASGGGSGGTAGTGGAGGPNPCPPGANYEPARNLCVIPATAPGSTTGSGTGTTIIVGRPFEGPSGGSVLGLGPASKLHKSPCLRGKSGAQYVIVGTNANDAITGTNTHDRILLLAGKDRAEGGRGDDCIDGATGIDTMSGALGADRIFGGSGGDHLVGGSHADTLHGQSGHDTINTGYGKDRVMGGSGNDRINAATAGIAAGRIGCGSGRDKVRINRNERKRHNRCERVYVIR